MLAVGVVHGDLSDFNVLVSGDEPVIIDFPQSVDSASNTNARSFSFETSTTCTGFSPGGPPAHRECPTPKRCGRSTKTTRSPQRRFLGVAFNQPIEQRAKGTVRPADPRRGP